MKENLKKVAKYFTDIFYVALVAPIILVKTVTDVALNLMIAFVYAILNDHDNATKVLTDVADKCE